MGSTISGIGQDLGLVGGPSGPEEAQSRAFNPWTRALSELTFGLVEDPSRQLEADMAEARLALMQNQAALQDPERIDSQRATAFDNAFRLQGERNAGAEMRERLRHSNALELEAFKQGGRQKESGSTYQDELMKLHAQTNKMRLDAFRAGMTGAGNIPDPALRTKAEQDAYELSNSFFTEAKRLLDQKFGITSEGGRDEPLQAGTGTGKPGLGPRSDKSVAAETMELAGQTGVTNPKGVMTIANSVTENRGGTDPFASARGSIDAADAVTAAQTPAGQIEAVNSGRLDLVRPGSGAHGDLVLARIAPDHPMPANLFATADLMSGWVQGQPVPPTVPQPYFNAIIGATRALRGIGGYGYGAGGEGAVLQDPGAAVTNPYQGGFGGALTGQDQSIGLDPPTLSGSDLVVGIRDGLRGGDEQVRRAILDWYERDVRPMLEAGVPSQSEHVSKSLQSRMGPPVGAAGGL